MPMAVEGAATAEVARVNDTNAAGRTIPIVDPSMKTLHAVPGDCANASLHRVWQLRQSGQASFLLRSCTYSKMTIEIVPGTSCW